MDLITIHKINPALTYGKEAEKQEIIKKSYNLTSLYLADIQYIGGDYKPQPACLFNIISIIRQN